VQAAFCSFSKLVQHTTVAQETKTRAFLPAGGEVMEVVSALEFRKYVVDSSQCLICSSREIQHIWVKPRKV